MAVQDATRNTVSGARAQALSACLIAGLVAALGLGACGDNLLGTGAPLASSRDLVLIAHQDDDLLFMQPDVIEAVRRGDGVTNVYVTAGNGTAGTHAADIRYDGLKEAYGAAAGEYDWDCGWIDIDGHAAQHCRLPHARVSLVFLAYPDGGKEGEAPTSLLHLWEGQIARATTVADHTSSYSQAELIDTVASIIHQTSPEVLRTLEVAGTHGHDHSDHMAVGALALLALGKTTAHPRLLSYRGYDIDGEPANKDPAVFAEIHPILARYEACAVGCAPCGQACAKIDPQHDTWLGRRYAVGFRRMAVGVLHTGAQCLLATGALGDCASAPVWSLARGALTTGGQCLTVAADGSLALAGCTVADPAQRIFADDEGHVWSAVPPVPQAGMDFAHLRCLVPGADGVARAELCGDMNAPTWDVLPPLATTERAAIGIEATGRAVRLGDVNGDGFADLCALGSGSALSCAAGDGAGHFGLAAQLATLAVAPDSLALGDLDGDGYADACGTSNAGALCALSSLGYATALVSDRFATADTRADTAASLQISAGQLCGADLAGVTCVAPSLTSAPVALSAWPAPSATVWPADLDGDGAPDWCAGDTGSAVGSAAGPACGLAAEAGVTTAGVPWMFSNGGVLQTASPDPALTALADIDGDGAADLCTIDGSRVACARSQQRGFGPLSTLLATPTPPIALWLGDLDGDGRSDACVDLGPTIACALAP